MKFVEFGIIVSLCLVAINAIPADDSNIHSDEGPILEKNNCLGSEIFEAKNVFKQFKNNFKDCHGIVEEKEKLEIIKDVEDIIASSDEVIKIYQANCKEGICDRRISVPVLHFFANVTEAIVLIEETLAEKTNCASDAAHIMQQYTEGLIGDREECIYSFIPKQTKF